MRGQAQDFDVWRQLGNVGWSYQDVLPYFKRSEDQERGADEYHGAGGPLGVSDVRLRQNQMCEAFIDACAGAGIPRNTDFNGADQEGAGYFQLTNRNGRRCSAAVAYLRPARARPNLSIITGALVHGLELDGRRATGVRFALQRTGCKPSLPRARSSWPPAPSARRTSCSCRASAPPQRSRPPASTCAMTFRASARTCRIICRCGSSMPAAAPAASTTCGTAAGSNSSRALEYAFTRRGILTIGAGAVGAFARSRPDVDMPDIQFHFLPLSADRPGQGLHKFSGVTATVCQLRPESRGTLSLASADPAAPPRIVSNYLAAEADRRVLLDGMKLVRRTTSQPAFAKFVVREHLPGPETASDEALMAYARALRHHRLPPLRHLQNGQRSQGRGRCPPPGARASPACGWPMPPSCPP